MMRGALVLALGLIAAGTARAQTPQISQPPMPAQTSLPRAAADSTVRPGMTEAEVRAAWGTPSGTRARGDYTYLFFANGCQPACGVQDVVILERGQVVDAVARGKGHRYDGVSSSPAGRAPSPTLSTPHGSSSR
jgi:hypothetical protein